VYAHEDVGAMTQPVIAHAQVGRYQAGNALERLHVAEDRQGIHGVVLAELPGGHFGTAYAFDQELCVALAQALDDAGRQQVARRLARHHADGQARRTRAAQARARAACTLRHGHGREMPRLEAFRKSTMIWMAAALSGWACCSCCISSAACSMVSLRR